MSVLDGPGTAKGRGAPGREVLAREAARRAFLDELRLVVREELAERSGQCRCGLDDEDRKSMGSLIGLCREVGIENLRGDLQFAQELRRGADHVKQTALTVVAGSILTALGAGLFLLFKTKVGN